MSGSGFHVLVTGIRWRERRYHWIRMMTLGCSRITFEKTADAALQFLQDHPVSLVIVDLDRPELQGPALVEALAAEGRQGAALPVIGLVTPGLFTSSQLAGFPRIDRFLEKPLWYDGMKQAVEDLLGIALEYRDMPAAGNRPPGGD